MKVRIIKRIAPDKSVRYVIQQKHILLRWIWVDAWLNNDVWTNDTFSTLEEAERHLCYFDGTKVEEEVILEK